MTVRVYCCLPRHKGEIESEKQRKFQVYSDWKFLEAGSRIIRCGRFM
jgi:hypothetical protein